MLQAVQIETQAEQQGLANLHAQAAARGPRRELAFDRGEYALDQSAASMQLVWKRLPHLRTNPMHSPSFLSPLGGDHTVRSELFPNVRVVPLAVELCISQHRRGWRFACGPAMRRNLAGPQTRRVPVTAVWQR